MKIVKNAQTTAQTTAVPPGIQPTSARNTRSNRSDDCPWARMNPVSVKSGMEGRCGSVARS